MKQRKISFIRILKSIKNNMSNINWNKLRQSGIMICKGYFFFVNKENFELFDSLRYARKRKLLLNIKIFV